MNFEIIFDGLVEGGKIKFGSSPLTPDKKFSPDDEKALLKAMKTAYVDSPIARKMINEWFGLDENGNEDELASEVNKNNILTIVYLEGQEPQAHQGNKWVYFDMKYAEKMLYIDDYGNVVRHTTASLLVHELVHIMTGDEHNKDNSDTLFKNQENNYLQPTATYANTGVLT